VLNWSKF